MLKVRDIVNMPKERILSTLPKRVTIEFEDGVVLEVTNKSVLYSHYFWEMHRQYPRTIVSSKHHVSHVLKGKSLAMDTHIKLLEVIFKDVVDTYMLHDARSKEPIWKLIYQITNNIHNELSSLSEEHVLSIDILDFIEVIEHPDIKKANDSALPNSESISSTYKEVTKVLNTDDSLASNALVLAIRSGQVNMNQVLQCISIRGFLAEVDGSILSKPIMTNYTKGMNILYDFVAESRSAARALYFSEAPLQDSEYFARRLQLLSMTVESLDYVDCGTSKYVEWRVSGPTYDDRGNMTYNGDLPFMTGKYYIEDGVLKCITHDDPALHNKVIKMRTVLYCEHPDPHKVCEICFGALAKNVSRHVNLGHLCSTTMTQQTSQSVLSSKHLMASSVSANIIITEESGRYFTTNKAKNAYVVKKELKGKSTSIVVSRDEAVGLVDVISVNDIDSINPARIAGITCIELRYTDKTGRLSIPIEVNQGNRKAIFTMDFIKYLRANEWETDEKNNFTIKLDNWDFSLPILKLPDMEYSYSDHSHQIAKVTESSMKNITDRSTPDSPFCTLQELFTLVNSKLNVNIAALEVIIYAAMTPEVDNYGLSRGADKPILGVAPLVIKNRSLGASYAYRDVVSTISNPKSFFKLNRVDSPFDVFLAPDEVVSKYKHSRK